MSRRRIITIASIAAGLAIVIAASVGTTLALTSGDDSDTTAAPTTPPTTSSPSPSDDVDVRGRAACRSLADDDAMYPLEAGAAVQDGEEFDEEDATQWLDTMYPIANHASASEHDDMARTGDELASLLETGGNIGDVFNLAMGHWMDLLTSCAESELTEGDVAQQLKRAIEEHVG